MSSTGPDRSAPQDATARTRSFILWAGLISIILHFAIGPLFANYKPPREDKEETETVSVTKKFVLPTPRPTPTPPPPTPPPKQTPPPVKQTAPPPVAKLKVNPPKTKSVSKQSSSENAYVAPAVGSQNGVPAGNAATGAPAPVVATNPPGTPAPPAPTKPSCANPNADAVATREVPPEYPEIAKQQGAVGTATVKVTLSATGSVVSATIYKSAGNAALDASAIAAAKASQYKAQIEDCVPTSGSYLFVADFQTQ